MAASSSRTAASCTSERTLSFRFIRCQPSDTGSSLNDNACGQALNKPRGRKPRSGPTRTALSLWRLINVAGLGCVPTADDAGARGGVEAGLERGATANLETASSGRRPSSRARGAVRALCHIGARGDGRRGLLVLAERTRDGCGRAQVIGSTAAALDGGVAADRTDHLAKARVKSCAQVSGQHKPQYRAPPSRKP